MSKFFASATLLVAILGCSTPDAFQDARGLAHSILAAELKGQACEPPPISSIQRKEMAQAVSRIDRSGLSDPAGLGPLNLAVISDDLPTIKRIGALGYPLDAPGSTLLHEAALHNSMQAVSFLLASGASPNSVNSYGATPLMSAAASGRLEVARSLLAAGASPNATNKDGGTALHYAIGCRNKNMVSLLLAADASIDSKAQDLAAKHGVALPRHER